MQVVLLKFFSSSSIFCKFFPLANRFQFFHKLITKCGGFWKCKYKCRDNELFQFNTFMYVEILNLKVEMLLDFQIAMNIEIIGF